MKKITKCVYAGSFDPPTKGHIFMIRKGSDLFDQLIVAVGVNPKKKYTFSLRERIQMLRDCTQGYDNVTVDHFEGQYLVSYAGKRGANYALRGIRSHQDYEFERAMRNVNEDLNDAVTSIFLMPPREVCEVSSSFVKDMVGPEGWEEAVRPYVPDPVFQRLLDRPMDRDRQNGGAENVPD